MEEQPIGMDPTQVVAAASFAVDVLREGDASGIIDELMSRQLEAEDEFRNRAYAAWSRFPDHPVAPALAALHRRLQGQDVAPVAFGGLAWLGFLLAEHRDDWHGREENLASRLRSAENFEGCLFELETSRILRSWGRRTKWLWPHSPEEPDLLLDESVGVECVHAKHGTNSAIPHRATMDFLCSVLSAMHKHRRNLLVVVEANGILRRADLSKLKDAVQLAVMHGSEGQIALPVDECTAWLKTLAPLAKPIELEEYLRIQQLYARERYRMGHVENSPAGTAVNPRMVVLRRTNPDPAIAATCRSILAKNDQLKPDRPAIVAVKFGSPVLHEQAERADVRGAVYRHVANAMAESNVHRISSVLWVFPTSSVFHAAGRWIVDTDESPADPSFVAFPISNPRAARPLPMGYPLAGNVNPSTRTDGQTTTAV